MNKLNNASRLLRAYSKSKREQEKRTVGKLNKTITYVGSKLESFFK